MNQLQLPCHPLSHQDSLPGCRDLLRFLQCINIMINKHIQKGHILSWLSSERNHNAPLQLHFLWSGKAATFIKMQHLSILLLKGTFFLWSQTKLFFTSIWPITIYKCYNPIYNTNTHPLTHTHIPTFLTIRGNKFLSQCYTHKTLEIIKTSTLQHIPLICCLN